MIHWYMYKSKNIFIKMLNNVGMAVPKIIRTRCSTYAARQWMIAYNNNNMRNPVIKDVGRGPHPYIVQQYVFTLVLLVFMVVCSCAELSRK